MSRAHGILSPFLIGAFLVACQSRSARTASQSGGHASGVEIPAENPASEHPTLTFVSEIGEVRQIDFESAPRLYKLALTMYLSVGIAHPGSDVEGTIVEILDGRFIGFDTKKSTEENFRDLLGLYAQSAQADWNMDAGRLQILNDGWAYATAVVKGTDDPATFQKYLRAGAAPNLVLDPVRLSRTREAMEVIHIKAIGRPPIEFSDNQGDRARVVYLENPKRYCAISRFLTVQQQIGEDWGITSAQAMGAAHYSAGLNSRLCPYNILQDFISMETRIEYRGRPDAQRLLAQCSTYIQGLAYEPRLYAGD